MRLFPGRIPRIAEDLVANLSEAGHIEVADAGEARLDVEAVLKGYQVQERELTDKTKDVLELRGLGREHYNRVRRALAEERGFGIDEDAVGYLADQIIAAFLHSSHVEEVFADDATLRAAMAKVLRKHMMADEELDAEVRKRIQNLEEGTAAWDIEYKRAMDQLKRAKGLE